MQDSFLIRLPHGADLLEAITNTFRERGVRKASFTLIGALTHCIMGYYDPVARRYESREFPGNWEIVSCMGNVSEKDNDIFVHAHIVIAGEDYQCMGGHLMPGSSIFAAELYATSVPGTVPVRAFDEPTGLALWSGQE
jgi:uncharacterized protein